MNRGGRFGGGTTLLTVYVVLLFGIPASYVVAPLGSVGAPAQVFALGLLMWWLLRWLSRPLAPSGLAQPVRLMALLVAATVVASYVAAMLRPIVSVESRAADRGLLLVLSWLGLILIAGDEIGSLPAFGTLLRRLVTAGGLVALLGIVQFQTGQVLVDRLVIPGLSTHSDVGSLAARSGFARPSGTATHPIEFGVVLTMLLPLALHVALSETNRRPLARWFPIAAMALAVPISVSRSAVVCTIVALGVLVPALPRRTRRVTYACTAVAMAVVYVAVPGMLGALLKLFTRVGTDDSAASRTNSYTLAEQFVQNSPLFGRGFRTFLPEYRILDNQYLVTLIETGIVGLVALLGLLGTAMFLAWRVRRRSTDPHTRRLAQALLASTAAGAASLALFDGFSFPMAAGLLMLVLGLVGSLARLTAARDVVSSVGERSTAHPVATPGHGTGTDAGTSPEPLTR
jgi:O-antigen ligase